MARYLNRPGMTSHHRLALRQGESSHGIMEPCTGIVLFITVRAGFRQAGRCQAQQQQHRRSARTHQHGAKLIYWRAMLDASVVRVCQLMQLVERVVNLLHRVQHLRRSAPQPQKQPSSTLYSTNFGSLWCSSGLATGIKNPTCKIRQLATDISGQARL